MGFYIAIEGVDGAGKTTQIKSLSAELREHDISVKAVRFQRFLSWPLAKIAKGKGLPLRQVFSPSFVSFLESCDEVLTYWFLVYPQRVAGKNVVRDRCGLTRLVNAEIFQTSRPLVECILSLSPAPQKIFILSVPAETAVQRAAAKPKRSPDDTDSYINAATEKYAKASSDISNVLAIDGLRSPEKIAHEIASIINRSSAGPK